MRKCLRVLLLGAVFTVLLCGSALATNGICNIQGTGFEPQKADGAKVDTTTAAADGTQVYADAERVKMTYSTPFADKEYLVFVLEDGTIPDATNIVYIDQKSGTTASEFNLYPSRLVNGKTYNVYVTNDDTEIGATNAKVGSFSYHADYIRGDASGDGIVDVSDATAILSHVVQKKQLTGNRLLAADVVGNGNGVDVSDATRVLGYIVQKYKEV